MVITALTIASGQLVAPTTPKLADTNAERVRITDEQKLVELQTVVRQQNALLGQMIAALHAAGVAGF